MILTASNVCIDRWEGALVEDDGSLHSPFHPVGTRHLTAVTRPGITPQAHVSLDQADAACQRAGKHICKDSDWVTACMGGGAAPRAYPYGRGEKKGVCNDHRDIHPLSEIFGRSAKPDVYRLNDPRINQLAHGLAKTGDFTDCVTPEGAFDMVGNLLEWTLHITSTGKTKARLMGGYYVDSTENGKGCMYATVLHDAQYADYSTGFRCCAPPGDYVVASAPAPSQGTVVAAVIQTPPAEPPAMTAAPAPAPAPVEPQAVVAPAEPAPSEPAEKPAPQVLAAPADGAPRDPPGFRSFLDPAAPLPPMPKPPAYDPANASCPVDMILVEGKRCREPMQMCLKPNTALGAPKGSCLEFEKPVRCNGGYQSMKYCIDKYEYTPENYTYPIVHVSWGEAQNICKAMDKRLCEENEWEFACEGPDAQPFPYGYVRNGEACHHDQPDLFDNQGNLRDQRVPAKSLPECKSPFGVMNIIGNVDEWTSRMGNKPPRRSILRGGWWLTGRNRCRASTNSHSEMYAAPQAGFRCCKGSR